MIPNLDVDLLKTFLGIADTGSFTRAAEEVSKTQSAVSMQMKRLEDVLGRPLFARDGRNVRFTGDGERLVEYARRMVALNDEAVSAFTQPELTGTVRFGTPDDYAEIFLPEVLARFHRTHPSITIDAECIGSYALHERVKSGEIDLALVTFCRNFANGEVLRDENLLWVTSARHSTHLLSPLPLATADAGCAWRRHAVEALDRMDRKFRIAYTSPNRSVIDAAVVNGLAVAVMPEICVKPGMRILTAEEGFPPVGRFEIGLLRRSGKLSPAVDALAQYVRERLSDQRGAMIAAA